MRFYGWGWDGWGIGLAGLLSLLIWVALIVVVVLLIAHLLKGDSQRSSPPAKNSAEEILKERFARGEISKEEYQDRLKTLRSS